MADSQPAGAGLPVAPQTGADLEVLARGVLPPEVYDYYAGGSETEATLREAPLAWHRWRLRPRMLSGVAAPVLATTVLGTPVASPIGVAPWALQRMAHPDGELATAAACARTGSLMTVSTAATTPLDEVAAVAPESAKWFQLYRVHGPAYTDHLVRRAAAAGYRALVLTVDLPILGRRLRDLANDFQLPDGLVMANHPDQADAGEPADPELPAPAAGGSGVSVRRLSQALDSADENPPWTYADLERFAGLTDLPVVVKGVLRGDDALRCLEAGASAVWVSTHGGRQVDRAVSSAVALVDVVSSVRDQAEVYVDGGIRSGTDTLVALALGARAVFCGRPVIWGLVTGGADGVVGVLSRLGTELAHSMTLCGVASVEQVPGDLVTS
ncbi:MAG: alpha-hydroxy-acid oxidizing protein [Geodermatophilaceae bacterium]|nr:alpha-hydroxy-acid oxidizing protein [Geodermatophilaceae bacterium]